MKNSRASSRAKDWLATAIAWLVLAGLYLLMVGQLSASEIVASLILASMITAFYLWSRSLDVTRFRFEWRLIAAARWLPGAIIWETLLVFLALGRRLLGRKVHGTTIKVPFKHAGRDPESATWRAAAVFGVSVSPNSYVTFVDTEKQEIHIRQLVGDTITRGDKELLGIE